ncbi:MAG: DUF3320 domain-containing protein [Sphaerospermopsis sp. SIO1G2]|nr:DUF3320 domain-containing protein [Sphaerospermopsis sp. SIO1G2]
MSVVEAQASKESDVGQPNGDPAIQKVLNKSRQSLLDLSLRNRLLNIPKQSRNARILHIHDELSSEILRILVQENRTMAFLAGRDKDNEEEQDDLGLLPQPDEDEETDERGIASRHSDRYLQTMLTSSGLQRRLLGMYCDARTLEEEQGVNILYLTLGTLKWYESDSSDKERYAPLLLIPVALTRGTAKEKFKLSWREEDISSNLSLQAKVKAEFGIVIPELPSDDEVDFSAYMHEIAQAVSGQKRFEVKENDITLGFFSFAKFLMYRDLDPENWPKDLRIDGNELVAGLLGDGFPSVDEELLGEDVYVDEHIAPQEMCHVVDADSSQTLAIQEVKNGRNLIIQGPPGTGKSQTITNVIATAVKQGKKVLFVAEKMAALEVVHRRLSNIGLGAMCLELHSHKSSKRQFLEELNKTMMLGSPRGHDQGQSLKAVEGYGNQLTKYANIMHRRLEPSGLTPYKIIGRLLALKNKGINSHGTSLTAPEQWSSEDYNERKQLLEDIAARLVESGPIRSNPWRGVMCQHLLPKEQEELEKALPEISLEYKKLMQLASDIEGRLPKRDDNTIGDFDETLAACKLFLALPDIKHGCLVDKSWLDDLEGIESLISCGQKFQALDNSVMAKFKEIAKQTDFSECHQNMAMHGGSLFSFVHGDYRRSKKFLASMLLDELPKNHADQLALVESIIEWQSVGKKLEELDDQGKSSFGENWKSKATAWEKCSSLLEWHKTLPETYATPAFLEAFAAIQSRDLIASVFDDYKSSLEHFNKQLDALNKLIKIDARRAFDQESIPSVLRDDFAQRLEGWETNIEALSPWITLRDRIEEARSKGMESLIHKLLGGELDSKHVVEVFKRSFYDALAEKVFTDYPDLRSFDGDGHHQLVENFKQNDLRRIEQARIEVAAFHHQTMPSGGGSTGPLRVLKGEFSKKRNHLPIRKLIKLAGPAVQAIKPVFMMSPLSIAQFLEPGAIEFDLLVIDEASQVEPVDALGAISRCKQIVVVGDNKQLPPTRFFARMTSNDNDSEEEDDEVYEVSTGDVESILTLCESKNLPARMLRWHYRSKHPSLIAVSNKEFYENKLFIIPSPYDDAAGVGLRFHHIKDGVYDSGGTSANAIEAKRVAEAVISHALSKPEQSLGVAAFSVKQRQAIMDELELLRRANPDAEEFFQIHPDESFFVKNLENVQGDERDVIFISVGYARNAQGYLAMRFGPLSAEGGERRLNVLISRAKRRCEVFSSITADDIDLERGRGLGVAALKLFVQYAETGQLDYGVETDNAADSIFEEQVAAALRSRGYDVRHQIGTAGFFVDLAIKDPDKPGRFIIGIECDGASYHSSRSARDRDRLRQQVLEAHGWTIHRIWSTDWFKRPQDQVEKTVQAIETAKRKLGHEPKKPANVKPVSVVERSKESKDDNKASHTSPYKEAQFPVSVEKEPHEVSDGNMANIVTKIVAIEGPVHEELVITRVRTLWNLGRAGTRIRKKVATALRYAEKQGNVKKEGGVYIAPESKVTVRDRSHVEAAAIRKPELIPPQEIRAAIITVITENFGADKDSLPVEVARLFGFQSTSPQLRDVIEEQIQHMLSSDALEQTENTISMKVA